ncbi:EamA family transporter [Hydrogenobacter hydrogenophilus]|uniref:Transporter family protein n=1 Tax=Hydrogenobacter hydrogenophilus TaxID=35835 RepID=A0A285NV84_9AQUI|nr:EamA family transporter [Hydrogenobacter hydrogenophilus]SNZ13404.1 transporter family protein [Hydrogenobacter hydrogenophilus]
MKAFFLALLASLVWGLAPSFFKLVIKEGIPPSVILIFHNLSAFITAVLITAILGESLWVNPKYLMFAFIGGFLSGFLGLYLFFLALRHGDVSIVSPVASISPLWSAMFAYVFLGESLSWQKVAGIVLIIAGVSLLSLSFQK